MAQPGHRAIGRLQADVIQNQVGGGVVGYGDHQSDGITERQPRSGCEVLPQQPRTGHLVVFVEFQTIIEIDPVSLDLPVNLDHHGQLDQAGRRHRPIGLPGKRTSGSQVPDENGHLAFVTRDQRLDPGCQPGVLGRRQPATEDGGGQQHQPTGDHPCRAPFHTWISHDNSPIDSSSLWMASSASSSSGTIAPGTRPSRSHSHNRSSSS